MELIKIARVPAVTATHRMSVLDVAVLMNSNDVGAVIILDHHQKIAGIFTERDNLRRVTVEARDPMTTPVSDVMTKNVEVVGPDISVEDALDMMVRLRCRHLPIVNETGQVLGIASLKYLLMRRISDKQSSIEALAAYVTAGGPG